MKLINETVQGLLLKDAKRKAGSKEVDGKLLKWGDGYIITILLVGGALVTDIKKYTVRPDLESSIQAQLADVEWGSLVTLSLEDGKVVTVSVESGSIVLD